MAKTSYETFTKRGITEEQAEKLAQAYKNYTGVKNFINADREKAITDIGVILSLGKEDTTEIIGKILGLKADESFIPVKMEPVRKTRDFSATEKDLISRCEKLGYDVEKDLSYKVIGDLAERIDKAKKVKLDSSDKDKLLTAAVEMYRKRAIDSNESAGIMAAQSIGEPGTQMNMRTFHNAGVANLVLTNGLPRLIEIVDARRVPSTPSMIVPLEKVYERDESVAKQIAYNIETTTLTQVADIEIDANNMQLIVTPDAPKMNKRELVIEKSDENDKRLAIMDVLLKNKNFKNSRVEKFKIYVELGTSSYKKLMQLYEAAKKLKVKGIADIKRAVIDKDKDGNYYIITEGSNLKEVMKVTGVDKDRVKSNSILEVADVLGIEAARNAIIEQAYNVLGAAGLNVDQRHIMLVADMMTNDGTVKAIGRHGISGKKSSVLARAAFEITAPHLLQAAINGELDGLQGVTENIITGQPVTLGTGAINLVYEPKKKGDKK